MPKPKNYLEDGNNDKNEVKNDKQILDFFRKNLAEIMLSLSLFIPQGANADIGKTSSGSFWKGTSKATVIIVDGENCKALTNRHVNYQGNSLKIELENGKKYTTNILYTDPNNDLVLLQLLELNSNSNKKVPAKNCDNDPYNKLATTKNLEKLNTTGYSGGTTLVRGSGKIYSNVTLREIKNGGKDTSGMDQYVSDESNIMIIKGTSVNPGQSGSPVTNNNGELVGIIFASSGSVWMAHDVKSIKAIFDKFKIPYKFNK